MLARLLALLAFLPRLVFTFASCTRSPLLFLRTLRIAPACLPLRFLVPLPILALTIRGIRIGPVGLRELAVDLVREVFDLSLGATQGGGLVAQDAPGRPFDPFAQLLDPLAGVSRGLGRFGGDPGSGQLLGLLERLGDRLLVGLADGVEEVLGQERLGLLGLSHRATHPLDEVFELLPLLLEALS